MLYQRIYVINDDIDIIANCKWFMIEEKDHHKFKENYMDFIPKEEIG
jgi:hypothetical protein